MSTKKKAKKKQVTKTKTKGKRMTKEVATKEQTPIAAMDASHWEIPMVSSKDTIVPKIMLMQQMSPSVSDGAATMGELRDNLNNKLLGNAEEPLEIVPIMAETVFQEFKGEGNEREYIRTYPVITDPTSFGYNDDLPYEGTNDEGASIIRDRVIQIYVLTVKDMEEQPAPLPYMMSFKSTSRRAGSMIVTQMYRTNVAAGKVPPATVIKISTSIEANAKKQKYAVMIATPDRASTEKEIGCAFKWYKTINQGGVKVQEDEVASETPSSTKADQF